MKELKGIIFGVVSAVIFGCMPIAAKYLYAEGCNSVSLVVYRYSLTLPILFFMALREQRKLEQYKQAQGMSVERASEAFRVRRLMRINRTQFKQFVILSLGFSMTPILLFASYNYISSGSATTIHFSYPIFVILASIFVFKEKATSVKIAGVVFCVLGLAFFYEPGQSGGTEGILLALISGVTYAFYMIYFDKSVLKFITPFKTNFYLSVVSAVLVLLFAFVTGSFVLLETPRAWLMALGFSFMLTVVACVLAQMGIALIGAQKTAVLGTFEPITSVLLGVVCFGEAVGIKTAAGVGFILAAVLCITLFDKKKTPAAE